MIDNLLRSLEEFQKEVNTLSQLSARSGETFSAYEAQALARLEEEKKRELKKKQNNEDAIEGIHMLSSSVVGFAKTMTSGQSGMTKYASSLSSLAEGVSKASKFLGLLGGPISFVASAVATLVGSVLEQNDRILDSYDALAQIGVSAGLTATELDKIVANSQGALDYMPSFVSALKKLGGNILTLGHSTAEGTKKFAEITSLSPELRDQFRRLGLSQEKVNELQADYIANYAFQDQLKDKDATAIRLASLNWIKETTALTAITGLTREQQVNANDALKQDVAYQAMMMSATDEQKAALNKMSVLFESMSPGWGREITRKVLMGYSISGELENALAVSGYTKSDFDQLREASKKGPEVFVKTLQEVMKRSNQVLEDDRTRRNLAQHEYAERLSINQSMIEITARVANSKTFEAVMKDLENQAKTGDSLLNARNLVINAENRLKEVFQSLIRLISGPVNKAFAWVAQTVTDFVNAVMGSKIYRFIVGEDKNGKQYTHASTVEGAEKNLAELLKLEEQKEKAYAKETAGLELYELAQVRYVKQREELEEIKKNRIQAERNLEDLKRIERETASQQTTPTSPPPTETEKEKEKKQPAPQPSTKTSQPTKAPLPQPVPQDKKEARIQIPSNTNTLLPPVASPVTINVATNPVVNAEKKPQPVPEKKQETRTEKKPQPVPEKKSQAARTESPPSSEKQPESRQFAKGGISSGPETGYSATLHDVEAVIPLPNNRSIPVTVSVNEEFDRMFDAVKMQGEAMRSTVIAVNKTLQMDFDRLVESLSNEIAEIADEKSEQPVLQKQPVITTEIDPKIITKLESLTSLFSTLLDKMRDNKVAHEMILHEVKRV